MTDTQILCRCDHAWHQHTSHASGSQPCKHFGCGCSDFENQTERLDPKTDYTVVYTLTLTVKRAAMPYDRELATSADVVPEMVDPKAFRQLEREVLKCLTKLDGDCDVEVIDYTTEEE